MNMKTKSFYRIVSKEISEQEEQSEKHLNPIRDTGMINQSEKGSIEYYRKATMRTSIGSPIRGENAIDYPLNTPPIAAITPLYPSSINYSRQKQNERSHEPFKGKRALDFCKDADPNYWEERGIENRKKMCKPNQTAITILPRQQNVNKRVLNPTP